MRNNKTIIEKKTDEQSNSIANYNQFEIQLKLIHDSLKERLTHFSYAYKKYIYSSINSKSLKYHRWRNIPVIGNMLYKPRANKKLKSLKNQLAIIDLYENQLEILITSLQYITMPQFFSSSQAHVAALALQEKNTTNSNIYFKTYKNPLVSIIIPVYGKIDYTLTCLRSIHQHHPDIEFEIIVVDDKSPDNTLTIINNIPGIKLIANPENMGFIHACNHGANAASGHYLYFLNNDTRVTKHWLDELVNTFYNLPGTGLVGSKLVYPNGTLQEAGGIIWQDGSAWNFGRNQDASLPIYNYAREVDYCSGASIMIPSDLFKKLGGFDEHYAPAYCEDADLALKVRENGYRVIYQPLSVVIHYEGITSGTDTTQGPKAYQIPNTKKLFDRWKTRLKNHQLNGKDVNNAKDRTTKQRILVLDHHIPTPDQDSGSVTTLNLMILLQNMGFQITFIPESNFCYIPEYSHQLQKIGIEVLYAPYFTSVKQHLIEARNRYDLALLFRPLVAYRHLKTIRKYCHKIKVLYHTIDLHYLRMTREAELFHVPKSHKAAMKMKQLEFDIMLNSDASIVLSSTELDILHKDLPKAKVYHLPHILNIPDTQVTFQDRRDIVFVGSAHHSPNTDAVQYFIKEIMPLLRKQLPGIRLYIIGNDATHDNLDVTSNDIIITGRIKELNPFLDNMRVAIAPLRFGAGIKGKIGGSMAVGLPTVATPIAAEGMSLSDEENILIADSPQAFANAVSRVYLDESLWSHLSKAGVSYAENTWGSKATWEILNNILKNINIIANKPIYPIVLFSSYKRISPSPAPEINVNDRVSKII